MSGHTPGPWHVVSDLPSYAIGAGEHRVVQTPNQNNYRSFGPSQPWLGISSDANARLIAAAPELKEALAKMLDFWGGYECPEVDEAIRVMQTIGEDRWSMQAQMDAAKAGGHP